MIKGKYLQKYPKQRYGYCAFHIVSLCSRSGKSFNQISLIVSVQLTEQTKIAFSYVTGGII